MRFGLLLLLPLVIFGQIFKEVCIDACEFQRAQQMFNPWYSGPLLTGSAHMMPVGSIGIQPYFYMVGDYGIYNGERRAVGYAHNIYRYRPVLNAIQAGVASWLDLSLALEGQVATQHSKSGGGFGDMVLTAGFKILEEDADLPAIKFSVGEIFPTGKFQRLNPSKNGLDAAGQGSFQTAFSLHAAKIFLRSSDNPLNIRSTLQYIIPMTNHVHGFNTYGGGYGTAGKVHLGNQLNLTFGMEFCFYERCVLVADLVYLMNNHTTFSGKVGTTASGAAALVGLPSSDQLSLSPVIEYNFSDKLGLLAGAWFTIYGRNTQNFVSGIIGLNYVFNAY